MKHKSTSIILWGAIFIVSLSLAVFLWLIQIMNDQTENDIVRIAQTYVSTINQETVNRFSYIEKNYHTHNTQIETNLLVNGVHLTQDVIDSVVENAASYQGLDLFAFLDEEGVIHSLHGDPIISIDDLPHVMQLVSEKKNYICSGHTKNVQCVLWITPAFFVLPSGKKTIALVQGISIEHFVDLMEINQEKSLFSSHIIRSDGSYLHTALRNYSDKFVTEILLYGKPKRMTSKEAALYFLESIKSKKTFSLSLHVDYDNDAKNMHVHENQRVFCTPLPTSDWYLLTIMPYGVLDEMVQDMAETRVMGMWKALALLSAGILLIFALYFRMTQKQMHVLEEAQKRALKAKNDAEEARVAMESASRAKSDFLSNMSHDMRTPMNAIIGMATIALQNEKDSNVLIDCVRKISLAGKHLLGLINDVLDMAKIETGKMVLTYEAISLSLALKTICDIVRPQIDANKQHFDVVTRSILCENVYCDSVRLNQILLNILSNAMKFTPEGGSILLRMHEEASPRGDDYIRVVFSVEDSGIGMSSEFQTKLFTAFEREDNLRVQRVQGTGLGLTITKHIVDAFGGSIEVKSRTGEGTIFTICLDMEKVLEEGDELSLPPWKILVVDDNADFCDSVKTFLTELGTRPTICHSAAEASAAVHAAEEEGEGFYVALIDRNLGKTDGITLACDLNASMERKMYISVISAYEYHWDEEKESCVTGFLSKPLFKSSLYHELRRYIPENENGGTKTQELTPHEFTLEGKRFLLAEDIDINAEVAMTVLDAYGASVEWAQDGAIAVEMFSASEAGYYDAILMDLRMPNMNGYEATAAIRAMEREDAKKIPIVALTADAFVEDAQKCLAVGMNAHLAKPLDVDRLTQTLATFLD